MIFANLKKRIQPLQDGMFNRFKSYIALKIEALIKALKIESNAYIVKFKDLKKTNYELGLLHYNNGAASDAILRFKIILLIWPDTIQAHYCIGRSYVELLKYKKAESYIKKYLEAGDEQYREEAKFCYDIINNRLSFIKSIPKTLIARHYDILAPRYDATYLTGKTNTPQEQLFNGISRILTEVGRPFG